MSPIARCGCQGALCTCRVVAGEGIEVTGNGSLVQPYVITNTGGGGDDSIFVRQRIMRWDLYREQQVRGLPSDDYAPTFAAIFADPDYHPGDIIELRSDRVFPIRSQVDVPESVTIRGPRSAVLLYDNGFLGTMFDCTGTNDVAFEGFHITAPAGSADTYVATQFAIKAGGPTWVDRTSRLTVREMRFSEMANSAVRCEFLTNARVYDSAFYRVAREGVMSLSVDGVWVDRNVLDTMTNPPGTTVSYPIAFSRLTTQNLTLRPQTTNFFARGNIVRNQTLWEGIDTHAGTNGVVADNILINCYQPIAIVSGPDELGAAMYAPHNVSVERNICLSTRSDGIYRAGIVLQGAGTGAGAFNQLATGIRCKGNLIVGHGTQNTSNSGGLIAIYTKGAIIEGNELYECSPGGVVIQQDNYRYKVANNRVEDCWSSNDAFRPACYYVSSTFSTGSIAGNVTSRGDKVATRVNERGISLPSGGGYTELGPNYLDGVVQRLFDSSQASELRLEARTLRVGDGSTANHKLGFYGAVPVVRPVVPLGSSADTINNALKQLGLFT